MAARGGVIDDPALLHERLTLWFQRKLDDPSAQAAVTQVAGGLSNLSYRAQVTYGAGKTLDCLVRCDPIDGPQAPYDIPGQFGMFVALRAAGVPAPEPYWLETDPAYLERDFFACSFLPCDPVGRLLDPADPLTPARTRALIDTQTKIHEADWASAGVDRYAAVVRPEDLTEFIDREMRFFPALPDEGERRLFETARQFLHAHKPSAFPLRLNHGDCSVNNYLFQGPDIVAVVDWEIALITDPVFDLGYYCAILFRFQPTLSVEEIQRQRDAFVELYRQRSNLSLETLPFWEALSNFRNALSWTQSAFAGHQSGYPSYRNRLASLLR